MKRFSRAQSWLLTQYRRGAFRDSGDCDSQRPEVSGSRLATSNSDGVMMFGLVGRVS